MTSPHRPAFHLALILLAGGSGFGSPAAGSGQELDETVESAVHGAGHAAPGRLPGISDPIHAVAPIAEAFRRAGAIQVDGRLDEAAWTTARAITDFTQIDPFEGQPVSERTEVRILFDDDALYVGAMLYDRGAVTTRLARRDAMASDSDFFVLLLDSYHDHETAFRFAASPSGLKRDEIVSGGRDMGGDTSWDPVWDLATSITDEGWIVEMRIPFSQLRFSPTDEQLWGLQIERRINRKQERAVFSFTPKTERGGIARFGHLTGVEGVVPGRRLELLPYIGGRSEYLQTEPTAGADFENPFRSGSDHFASVGLDLKYRLSSNVTLDATVNPDFGQVEMDPAEINLTIFETRFDEKRPFFVEGQEIFSFGEGGPAGSTGRGPQLLYSRRIGRSPQGQVPSEAVFAEVPTATTIVGAAKLTGKIGDGWSVGVLNAVTGRENARFVDGSGVLGDAALEPATNYFVGRVRRDFLGGRTRFGVIASTVTRDLGDASLQDRLRGEAYAGGIEFRHESADRMYRLSSSFSPSLVRGGEEAILRTQQSGTRYLQRPDAAHLSLDPAATSLAGYYAMVDLNKQAGMYQVKVAVAAASPGYEVNDLGFQNAADRIILDTNFTREVTRPGRYFRRWDVRGGPDAIWNYGGDRVFAEFNVFATWQLVNYWGGNVRLAYNPETDDDRLTRGGPLAREPAGYSGNMSLNTDSRKVLGLRTGYQWGFDDGGSNRKRANLNLTYKPKDNWELRAGPSVSRNHNAAQFVTSVADPLATQTFGRRYVFAGLEQTTVGLETRLNVTFSPTLSFELYAEPFVSAGEYGALKEFETARSFRFRTYGEEGGSVVREEGGTRIHPDGVDGPAPSFLVQDPDFNFRSLLGNAVVRWEWRPGSTLYLVWQQSRAGRLSAAELEVDGSQLSRFDLGRDGRGLLSIRPDNIFLIKVNYWLNP